MVCERCIRVVKEELENAGFPIRRIDLGEAEITATLDKKEIERIKKILFENGFELIEDSGAKTIDAIKRLIIKFVQQDQREVSIKTKYSKIIAEEIGKDYHSLSLLFSSVENITIEKYIILQRIERAKELLKYGDENLSEISLQLGYSSVQHLSNQFKSITGLTPSEFKKQTVNSRLPIDKIR
ncbi:MAG: helix-turn-helix transcriptional regulator [Bacteroidetes bacterium]|nr:helix-turn-helix transcriptional regulator [Bacteroidota bacterium]